MSRNDEDAFIVASAAVSLAAPSQVFFLPFVSPPSRRLSSSFTDPSPSRPGPAARKIPAWISLQGRLVGADEATSSGAIAGGGMDLEAAVAWELFTPIQRVLIVAIVAVAASQSNRDGKIVKLRRSVELRDHVLLNMQQKLDTLCDQMNSLHEQPTKFSSMFFYEAKDKHFANDQKLELRAPLCPPGSSLPVLNPESGILPLHKHLSHVQDVEKASKEFEYEKEGVLTAENPAILEHEERRMSDLSDFNCSVTSSMDFQLSTLAAEQEFYNLRKECEDKDAKIKELTKAAHVSSVADSKRIVELEEIIRRKNQIISKMKKDMLVLEQQVINLTRLRRASSTPSNSNNTQHPVMANNILYDMSSTSPSSSDPESPVPSRQHSSESNAAKSTSKDDKISKLEINRQPLVDNMVTLSRSSDRPLRKSSCTPKENQRIQKSESTPVARRRQLLGSTGGDAKKTSIRTQRELRITPPQRR